MKKVSNYNFCYDVEDGKKLIYNTRSNALAVLDQDHGKKYNKFLQAGVITDTDFEKNLEKGGYIIEEKISELELLRNQMLSNRYTNSSMALTIAVTADCNFRCVYCYEKDSIKTSKMTIETQDAIVEFVKKQVKKLSSLQISWYGGEPLLAFDAIEYLSPKFIELCEDNNIDYSAYIVTNGYLLTPEKAAILKKVGVTSIQVTLDGPEEIHNKRRPLAGGQGTFKKIILNLKECVNLFETDKKNEYQEYCKMLEIEFLIGDDIKDVNMEHKPNLSGGEKQKISIIRSLLKHTSVIIFDEPTSALDKDSTEKLIKIINEIKIHKIIIIITHDENISDICDYSYVFN